jgi:hypothetical protein
LPFLHCLSRDGLFLHAESVIFERSDLLHKLTISKSAEDRGYQK